MIETVVSANMLIGEVMRVKKNHLAPDFPTGNEKRLCIVFAICHLAQASLLVHRA